MVSAGVDADVLALVRDAVGPHASAPGGLLPALHAVHDRFGYVDPAWVGTVADVFNLSRAEVHGVLTFYSDFRATPPARVQVRVCRAEACQAVGARLLLAETSALLDVPVGESRDDVELTGVFCLGNCALGPSAQVDGVVHGRVTAEDLERLVEEAGR